MKTVRHARQLPKSGCAFVMAAWFAMPVAQTHAAEVAHSHSIQKETAMKHQDNPFNLVYQGTITKNEPGQLNIHPVHHQGNGIGISANIYTPPNFDPAKSYPAITVAHPNGGVTEQVAGLYAQRLAEKGYIAIAADAAYQGASGGQPRQTDKPANRTNDMHAMVDFLET